MRLASNLEKKIPKNIYQKDEQICMKVQAHGSSEPLLDYNQD